MEQHDLIPGSPEWLAYRRDKQNASDAPVMLSCSPYKTRSQLLHELATGFVPDVDGATQRRFDDGHLFEELARPIAEKIIGKKLYMDVRSNGKKSASFDGLTADDQIAFEHKTLNEDLRSVMVEGCTGADLPKHYRVQMEQQCMVSGCEKVLFMASKWNDVGGEYELAEERHCWYTPDAELREEIIHGWAQFDKDLADYVPEAPKVEAVGRAPDALPALRIEVTGMVTASNLQEFHGHALAVIGSINTDLATDNDFASAEKTVKWCKDVEERLESAKQHALSQTASIDDLFRTIDSIREEARQTRLNLDKQVKSRKDAIRIEIQQDAARALHEHVKSIEATLDGYRLPDVRNDFAGAMKGKKTITSLRDAVDGELARAKIEANQVADKMRLNIARLRELASDHKHLFPDAQQLVLKAQDDMEAAIKARIADAEAEQKRKSEAEDQRRQAEAERAKQQAESAQAASKEIELETVNGEKAKVPAEKPYAQGRPSDMDILNVLANHFGTDLATVIGWIEEMKTDLEKAA